MFGIHCQIARNMHWSVHNHQPQRTHTYAGTSLYSNVLFVSYDGFTPRQFTAFNRYILSSSVSAPNPCGSVLKWLPWIRIRIVNTDPDPGQSKWCPKRKQNLRFQVIKSNDHFAEGLMVFTRGWESSINVFFKAISNRNFFLYILKKYSYILAIKKPGSESGSGAGSILI